jgi:hypothetical protein
MGMYEKALGLFWVPLLFFLLALQSANVFRRQINYVVQWFLKIKFDVNGHTIYMFPLIAFINLAVMVQLYLQMMNMHEPEEGDKAVYYQLFYRTLRNMLLNALSVILILQIFFTGRAYAKYMPIGDRLKEALKKQKQK